jgi:hypothetical protein
MNAFAATGGGFLIAVLWFDLMFDVQVRQHVGENVSAAALASISTYYRRVTTDARPMNRLVALVMALTVLAIVVEIMRGTNAWWVGWPSLVLAVSAIGLVAARTVPNAVRLGRAADTLDVQARLARTIYADHLYCLAAMGALVTLQLASASL